MPLHTPEFNTIITLLGMMCATVQATTGWWAFGVRGRPALLRTNDALNRAHRAFGSFATAFYALGLFSGINSFVGALRTGRPPLELASASFNIHTWGSFPVLVVIAMKTWYSYFDKGALYRRMRWLGPAAFAAWAFTWITAAISFYLRTLPSNPQHPAPNFLLPYRLLWLQIVLPFAVGGLIGLVAVRRARGREDAEAGR